MASTQRTPRRRGAFQHIISLSYHDQAAPNPGARLVGRKSTIIKHNARAYAPTPSTHAHQQSIEFFSVGGLLEEGPNMSYSFGIELVRLTAHTMVAVTKS